MTFLKLLELENSINLGELIARIEGQDSPSKDSIRLVNNNISSEINIEESTSANNEKYILVISVLSNKNNADNFLRNNSNAKYELISGKYYIYEKEATSKNDLEVIQSSYNKESWIKKIK